ncbi:hypothetical protein Droror1_Dr00020982 [Drosera rotundifolia]
MRWRWNVGDFGVDVMEKGVGKSHTSRLCFLASLSIFFWTFLLYFHFSVSGASSFSSPHFVRILELSSSEVKTCLLGERQCIFFSASFLVFWYSSFEGHTCELCLNKHKRSADANINRHTREHKHQDLKSEEKSMEELNEVAMIEEPDAGAYDLSCSTNQLLKEYIQMHEVPQTSSVIEGSYSQETGKVLTRYQKRRMVGYTMEGFGTVRSSAHLFGTPSTSSRAKTILIDGDHRPKSTFSTLIDEIRKLDATNGALCSPKKISFHHIRYERAGI